MEKEEEGGGGRRIREGRERRWGREEAYGGGARELEDVLGDAASSGEHGNAAMLDLSLAQPPVSRAIAAVSCVLEREQQRGGRYCKGTGKKRGTRQKK